MNRVRIKRFLAGTLAASVLMCGYSTISFAEGAEAADGGLRIVYPSADIQFRNNNNNQYGTSKGLEVRHNKSGDQLIENEFLGGLKFDLTDVDTANLKSASVELVTETRDNSGYFTVKPFSDDWSEEPGNRYSEKAEIIDEALNSESVAEFQAKIGKSKLFEATSLDNADRVLANWTSTFDITEYVADQLSADDKVISLLITPQNFTNEKGAAFLSKDASAENYGNPERWNAIMEAFSAEVSEGDTDMLKPRLVLEYYSEDERPKPTSVTVSGEKSINSYNNAAEYTYTAKVFDQSGNIMVGQAITWSSESDAADGAVSIDETTGVLAVPENASAQTVRIKAYCGDAESEEFLVNIVCAESSGPDEAAMTKSLKTRGNGRSDYVLDGSNGEIGTYTAHAVAIMAFDLNEVIQSGNYLSKITLNIENQTSDFARPIGAWFYKAPEADTRNDGRAWSDKDWTSSSNQNDIKNNISLALGMDDYAGGEGNVASGRDDFVPSIAEASVSGGKYVLELSGETLDRAIEYAAENDGMLELVVTSANLDSSSENRSRIYMSDSGEHRAPYLSMTYNIPESIEITGPRSVDLSKIDSYPAEYNYTAAVIGSEGGELPAEVKWSYTSSVSDGKVTFDTNTGILTVNESAAPQIITITAECGGIASSIDVHIDRLYASRMEIIGDEYINNYIGVNDREYEYTAKVYDQNDTEIDNVSVSWEFSTDAESGAAKFDSGILTVPAGAVDQTVTLKAAFGSVEAVKTVKIGKTILDLPETFTAAHSMKLRGLGNTSSMAVEPEIDEIGMKAAAPGLFGFDLSNVLSEAKDVITGLTFTVYKESGTNIELGLWDYADPQDTERTDGRTWIDADWTDTSVKSDILNNYSLVFGFDDFSAKHETAENNYAQGRTSYIAPISTASINENKYSFTVQGEALAKILEHAEQNGGMVQVAVTSADLDARTSSIKLYMTGVSGTNSQYAPTMTVEYDLPSTPRRIEISGNDTLYINDNVESYTSQYTAAVYDQFDDLYEDQSVEWSVDYGETQNILFDTETGVLTVNSSAAEGVVTVTAKSAYASASKTITISKIPDGLQNGGFESVEDTYFAKAWTPNVPTYRLNFDETDFYYPWNEAQVNDGKTLWTRTQGAETAGDTGSVRGTSDIDSALKMEYTSTLSDEEALSLMNTATQSVGINNSNDDGFLDVGYELPYYYMLDYYLSPDAELMLSNQGIYIGLEFRNTANTGFLASVATGDNYMPLSRGQWRTFTGTFTSGTSNQINGKTRVNIGIRGMKGTGYADYFRLVPKGIDTQTAYEGSNSMLAANSLAWTSDIFSVDPGSDYTYYASVLPESEVVSGKITYTFMDNNFTRVGEYSIDTDADGWSEKDENGWMRIEGTVKIPDSASVCRVEISNPENVGNVWFDGLVFTKTGDPVISEIRITSGVSEAPIPMSGDAQYAYSAVAYDQYGNSIPSGIAWSISGADGMPVSGADISANGILKVSASAEEREIIITASNGQISASKTVRLIKSGAAGEPISTSKYGFNGSFIQNDGKYPLGWSNTGKDLINYTFDNGIEGWKFTNTDYGAPMAGETRWDSEQNYTAGVKSGSMLLYNPSYNMPSAQIPNDVRIQGGMPYEFSMYFKQQNVSDDSLIRVNLRYFNSTGATIAETANMLRYYPNDYLDNKDTNGWQKWSGVDTVPLNASTVRVETRFRGGLNNKEGYAWFDDIRISKVTEIDKTKTYGDSPSLMLVGYNEDKTTAGKAYGERWLSDRLINISQGVSYKYGAAVQTYTAESGAYLSFVFYDADGNEISTINSDKISGTVSDWTELSGTVTAPAGAVSAAVGCNIDGKGTAWIADVSFTAMNDTGVSGISISGADSIRIPVSGSKSEAYTVNFVNSGGNPVGAVDAEITASNLPVGVTFDKGILTVTSSAKAGSVTLRAEYNGYAAEKRIVLTTASSAPSGGGGGGGFSGGLSGGTTVSGTSGGGGRTADVGTGTPMGNVNYGDDSVNDSNQSGDQTASVPSLLQPPDPDYFSGGGKTSSFGDIADVPWAEQAINALYKAGIVNGEAEGVFAPNDNVTRAEFLAMLVRTFNLASENNENGFSDVNEGDWYFDCVNTAVGTGIVNGISEDYFGAEENITRQDIAVMCLRLWDAIGREMTGNINASFTDYDEVSDYALDAVASLAQAGIVNGNETGAFKPLDNATRAEAAVIIYRLAVKYDE